MTDQISGVDSIKAVTPNEFGMGLESDTTDTKFLHPSTAKNTNAETARRWSMSTVSDNGWLGRRASQVSYNPYTPQSAIGRHTWREASVQFWKRNQGLWLVAFSQLFGAMMNVTTRVLELENDGMEPFQILFWRMGLTSLFCCLYMWYTKVPDFPLGAKGVRALLVARGLTGFFGIFGMYYSLKYLPMADATVITFLAPSVAGYACYLMIGEPFTRMEQIASYIALLGVVMIARPTSFFDFSSSPVESIAHNGTSIVTTRGADYDFNPTNAQRLSAVAIALLGVLGSAGAFTSIRWIGKRAHPLLSVNYFAVWCTIVSTTALTLGPHLPPSIASPTLHFQMPANLRQWCMLLFLGSCGFIMQFMMTAGMSHEKSNRATNMVYTSMIFALGFDRWIFGTVPGWWSLGGCACILGSAIFIAVRKADGVDCSKEVLQLQAVGVMPAEEEVGMLSDMDGSAQEAEEHLHGSAESTATDIDLGSGAH